MRHLFITVCFLVSGPLLAQTSDSDYEKLKAEIVSEFQHAPPGKFGPFVKGVAKDIVTNEKILALTFDACGGFHGNGLR